MNNEYYDLLIKNLEEFIENNPHFLFKYPATNRLMCGYLNNYIKEKYKLVWIEATKQADIRNSIK